MKQQDKNPKREKALEKVRKILSLANDESASEGEIENALKFAQKIMADFNIEQDEVDLSPDDIDIELVDNDQIPNGERKYWFWDLLDVIGSAMNCRIIRANKLDEFFDKEGYKRYRTKKYYKIIGTREDRILVKEMFEFTVPLIRNLYQIRYKEMIEKQLNQEGDYLFITPPTKKFFIASYIEGFIQGLGQKLLQQKQEIIKSDYTGKFELIVVKKDDLIQDYIDRTVKNLKKASSTSARSVDGQAFRMGIEDGKDDGQKKIC